MYSVDRQAEKNRQYKCMYYHGKARLDGSFFLACLGKESSGHSEKVAPAILKFTC